MGDEAEVDCVAGLFDWRTAEASEGSAKFLNAMLAPTEHLTNAFLPAFDGCWGSRNS